MSRKKSKFSIIRIYSDQNGHSCFDEIRVPLILQGEIGFLSEKMEAKSVEFRVVNPEYNYDYHTAPKRQFIFLLDGAIQIETSLGEQREFSAGDVLLVEDTWGKGHRTKNLTSAKRKSVFVEIPESLNLNLYLAEQLSSD